MVNDMKIRVQAPKEVADYISRNQSFSKCGETLCGNGGNYVTENKNRHLKVIYRQAFLPYNVGLFQFEIIKS